MSDQGNNADVGSDDFSGLTGFFFYAFIVHPITAWILRPGRFERKKSILYAIAFLAGLAALKTGTNNNINKNDDNEAPRRVCVYVVVVVVLSRLCVSQNKNCLPNDTLCSLSFF